MERFEVFLNVFAGFVNLGKSEKTEETLANFSEKSKRLKKKRKEKKNLPLRFCIIF